MQLLPNETLTIVITDPTSATLPYVNVTGCLRVEGVVNVTFATPPPDTNQAITIAESPCLTFNGTGVVTVGSRNNNNCKRVSGSLEASQGRYLSVLFASDGSCKKRGLSPGAIAGISVGVVCVTAVVVIGGVLVAKYVYRARLRDRRR